MSEYQSECFCRANQSQVQGSLAWYAMQTPSMIWGCLHTHINYSYPGLCYLAWQKHDAPHSMSLPETALLLRWLSGWDLPGRFLRPLIDEVNMLINSSRSSCSLIPYCSLISVDFCRNLQKYRVAAGQNIIREAVNQWSHTSGQAIQRG